MSRTPKHSAPSFAGLVAAALLLVAAFGRAHPPDPVYLAIRTDGLAGSGAAADPYDASVTGGVSRFDARMREITTYFARHPRPDGRQHEIHLAQGIYRTWGDDGNFAIRGPGYGCLLSPHTMLAGAGMGRTIIQLIGVKYIPGDPSWGRWSHAALASGSYGGTPKSGGGTAAVCDRVTVQDLTVDCNTAEFHPPGKDKREVHDYSIDGVRLNGSDCTVRRVEVLHALGTTGPFPPAECAAISFFADGADSRNALVEYCIVDKPTGDYVNGIALHNAQNNTHGIDGIVRYCLVRDNPQWVAYSSSSGFGGKMTEFYGNTGTNVGYGFRWDTNNLCDTRLKYNTFLGSRMGTAAAPSWRTPRAVELSPGSLPDEKIGNFQIEGNYFRFPGDGKGFVHMQFARAGSGVPAVFEGLSLKDNTFASDDPANAVCALDIDDGVPDHPEDDTYLEDTLFGDPHTGKEYNTLVLITNRSNKNLCQDIRFLGENILLGNAHSRLWRQQGLPMPQPDIRLPVPPATKAPSVQIDGSDGFLSRTGMVGKPMSFTVQAKLRKGMLVSFNLPKGSQTSPALPLTATTNPSITFSWTPSIDQAGTHTISFLAEGGSVGFGVASVNILPNPHIAAITWRDPVHASVTYFPAGSWVQKSWPGGGNLAWNSSAVSTSRVGGDGSVSFRFPAGRNAVIALSAARSNIAAARAGKPGGKWPEYWMQGGADSYTIHVNADKILTGSAARDDIFTISRESGIVRFYKNDTLLHVSPHAEKRPLLAECLIADVNSAVSDCTMTNGTTEEEVQPGAAGKPQ